MQVCLRTVFLLSVCFLLDVQISHADDGAIRVSRVQYQQDNWILIPIFEGSSIQHCICVHKEWPMIVWSNRNVDTGWNTKIVSNVSRAIGLAWLKNEIGISDADDVLWPVSPAGDYVAPSAQPSARYEEETNSGEEPPFHELLGAMGSRMIPGMLDLEWEECDLSVLGMQCEPILLYQWLGEHAMEVASPGAEIGVHRLSISQVLGDCQDLWDVHPPEFVWNNLGDQSRYDPNGNPYFTDQDLVLFGVDARDRDRGLLPCQLTVNGEPWEMGRPIEDLGIKTIVATALDDAGNTVASTYVVNIRPRIEKPAFAVVQEVMEKVGPGGIPVVEYTVSLIPGEFDPFHVRLTTVRLGGFADDYSEVYFSEPIKGLFGPGGEVVIEDGEFGISDSGITARFSTERLEVPGKLMVTALAIDPEAGHDISLYADVAIEFDASGDPPPLDNRPDWYMGAPNGHEIDCRSESRPAERDNHRVTGETDVNQRQKYYCSKEAPRGWHSDPNNHTWSYWQVYSANAKGGVAFSKMSADSKASPLGPDGQLVCGISTDDGPGGNNFLDGSEQWMYTVPCVHPCEILFFEIDGTAKMKSRLHIRRGQGLAAVYMGYNMVAAKETRADLVQYDVVVSSGSLDFGVGISWPPSLSFPISLPTGWDPYVQQNPHVYDSGTLDYTFGPTETKGIAFAKLNACISTGVTVPCWLTDYTNLAVQGNAMSTGFVNAYFHGARFFGQLPPDECVRWIDCLECGK